MTAVYQVTEEFNDVLADRDRLRGELLALRQEVGQLRARVAELETELHREKFNMT